MFLTYAGTKLEYEKDLCWNYWVFIRDGELFIVKLASHANNSNSSLLNLTIFHHQIRQKKKRNDQKQTMLNETSASN